METSEKCISDIICEEIRLKNVIFYFNVEPEDGKAIFPDLLP